MQLDRTNPNCIAIDMSHLKVKRQIIGSLSDSKNETLRKHDLVRLAPREKLSTGQAPIR